MSGLRIAILTHSTNPRGGVVHALELGDALTRLGHHAVVHAPDPHGAGFFRSTLGQTKPLPARWGPESPPLCMATPPTTGGISQPAQTAISISCILRTASLATR